MVLFSFHGFENLVGHAKGTHDTHECPGQGDIPVFYEDTQFSGFSKHSFAVNALFAVAQILNAQGVGEGYGQVILIGCECVQFLLDRILVVCHEVSNCFFQFFYTKQTVHLGARQAGDVIRGHLRIFVF